MPVWIYQIILQFHLHFIGMQIFEPITFCPWNVQSKYIRRTCLAAITVTWERCTFLGCTRDTDINAKIAIHFFQEFVSPKVVYINLVYVEHLGNFMTNYLAVVAAASRQFKKTLYHPWNSTAFHYLGIHECICQITCNNSVSPHVYLISIFNIFANCVWICSEI